MAACTTCRQNRCICSTTENAFGIPLTVTQPEGDELNASELADLLPCDSSSCTSTPADPNVCCNYFNSREGGNGDSFFYSAGGPFLISKIGTNTCPIPVSSLTTLPAGTGTHQDPGILADVVCVDLQPGTFKFDARFELHDAAPGTRVVVLYRPDCNDDTEYLVSDCALPCASCVTVSATPTEVISPPQNIMCSNFMVVPNNTCNPGFRILALGGHDQGGCVGSSCPTAPFIRNVQLSIERMTSRDLVDCNTSALVPGVLPMDNRC